MANIVKAVKKVTPKGQLLYAKLREPDVFNGQVIGYTIQMKFDEAGTKFMLDLINKEFEAGKEAIDLKPGQRWSKEPFLSYHEDKDGDTVFKFKTATEFKTKVGDVVKRVIPIFDAKGNKVEVAIGNGSIGRVAFLIKPYWVSNKTNGVTLRLLAVQVTDLVEYGTGSADSYGFEEEDGYTYEAPKEAIEKVAEDDAEEEF